MYERMLNKQQEPSVAEMTSYCGQAAELFTELNEWLSQSCGTTQERLFLTATGMDGGLHTESEQN